MLDVPCQGSIIFNVSLNCTGSKVFFSCPRRWGFQYSLSMLIHNFTVVPIGHGNLRWDIALSCAGFSGVVLGVLSSLVSIMLRKESWLLCFNCVVAVQ